MPVETHYKFVCDLCGYEELTELNWCEFSGCTIYTEVHKSGRKIRTLDQQLWCPSCTKDFEIWRKSRFP